ncbi:unnamed protein product [Chrysodeixis includens]|uniref:Uncharacterized protein n=1 Tax=Chrysodeixis includens TaxID=689277 RepID=A0A9P0FQI3_CHRIL|nr:unnamed protein product [Chrysodeixis includens]
MADNLPLIPGKGSVCTDVRGILRNVFRELDCLPPLATDDPPPDAPPAPGWIEKYKSECKEIWGHEGELKEQHAKRISQEPLPNIYRLFPESAAQAQPTWRLERGLLARADLVPNIEQDAGRDGTLWIKNALNVSSCELVSQREQHAPGGAGIAHLSIPYIYDDVSLQTLSIGAIETRPPPPPPAPPPESPQPDYIVCVPPQLDFVNFTIGHLHTQGLRLVNVSKFEIRLSVRPPRRRELDVELSGPRGLTVTSGAAAELRVHFRPSDVRALADTLHIRVSMGRDVAVPIACYMQPPLLDILVPSITSSVLSCRAGAPQCPPQHGSDVLELGARLLGDVHCARLLLHCSAEHASFFMLTDDAWLSLTLDCLSIRGSVVSGPFALWPAWWGGGGAVRGCAWCCAPRAGLHTTALRVLSSTAIVRQLYVLADSLLFSPEHLTIEAHEKDYDICEDGEAACAYYVHLGTAFPHRALGESVQLINHSPVVYSYYWSVRPWGVCSCWDEERATDASLGPEDDTERLCKGAREARVLEQENPEAYASRSANVRLVHVEPARGQILPRSVCALHVLVPDVGARLGVQRAVLMLILKDIPKTSFPADYDPMIVSTEEVESEAIPGLEQSVMREVCEVVVAQMEVWWEVVPLRFVLDPPVLPLYYSRRVHSVLLEVSATQLYGCEGARAAWLTPAHVPTPPRLRLAPAMPALTTLTLSLPTLPNHFPETDIITLVAAKDEWRSQCSITRQCATRHPSLRPDRAWLGVVAPGSRMRTTFQLHNDTHQHICWWAEAHRWWGGNVPSAACRGRPPCEHCRERACSCGLLKPARGALAHAHLAQICYDVNAPECDGCVATLVQARRTSPDVARVPGGAGCEARAALVAYRVLAPRLLLRVLPCAQAAHASPECTGCELDGGAAGSARGSATLRPARALTLGRRTCYRLRLTNITPLPTAVHFDEDMDSMDVLRVMFIPSESNVRAYGEIEIRVVLEARRVCGRRLFVYRAHVESAYRPLYLVVDTAIEGLRVAVQVPLGSAPDSDSFAIMRRTQREEFPRRHHRARASTPHEMFLVEDQKRAINAENVCGCKFEMVYVEPSVPESERRAPPSDPEQYVPVDVVTSPPELTRVCACASCTKPVLPELPEPVCLQFTAMPLNTVRTRTLTLRNESVVTAHWSSAVRNWPRMRNRKLVSEQWDGDVPAPGVAVQCAPAGGVLAAHAEVRVHVRVLADCWGLYHDQLLVQVENVEPLVLDVWVEALGPPLQLALRPADRYLDVPPTLWISASDPERTLRARNVSRCDLGVQVYVTRDYEYPQDMLPFRLYLRTYDVLPRSCPCLTAFDFCETEPSGAKRHVMCCEADHLMDEQSEASTIEVEMDVGVEVYLAPDYGPQDDEHYVVTPEERTLAPGEGAEWRVTLQPPPHEQPAPDASLLLRMVPLNAHGQVLHTSYINKSSLPKNKMICLHLILTESIIRAVYGWHRPEPLPQVVRLQQTERRGRLKLSCREQCVKLCALDLPYGDILRIRKRFHVLNVGNGPLNLGVETSEPWCVVNELVGKEAVKAAQEGRLLAQMCVEVQVSTAKAWPKVAAAAVGPCQAPQYPLRRVTTTPLSFYDEDNILASVPLVLDMEYPALLVEPATFDFGFVADGDSRKTYFSVKHTSRTVTLDVATAWVGEPEFLVWPHFLRIAPGCSKRVYLQYTAIWRSAPAEGCARVWVCCGAGAGAACGAEDAEVAGGAEDAEGAGGAEGAEGAGGAEGAKGVGGAEDAGAGGWCRAAVLVRAVATRDFKCRAPLHDHTDDPQLLPPEIVNINRHNT